jgi:hypothetical protein
VARLAVVVVLVGYLGLGVRYAVATPLWQVPDEPAHYNYVAQVADDTPDPPELTATDYPYARLESLKAARFPVGESIDGIAYEDYQPPAYYYLAAPAFRTAGAATVDRVRAVRLFGVLLGALTVTLAFATARRIFPHDAALAVATAAFVAFLPMHLAMTAAVNNDPLAYLVAAALLYVALGRIGPGRHARGEFVPAGLLVGLALLTKVSVYPAAAVIVAADLVGARRTGRPGLGPAVARSAATLGLGLLIALPWFVRNMLVYGATDPLGTARHDQVVLGQPRTAAWIGAHGVFAWAERLCVFTFESFWGVFGWLGVFLDARVYQALAVVTAVSGAGLAGYILRRARRRQVQTRDERSRLAVAALMVLLAAGLLGAYNLGFVQHQGRYLFTALVPIALLFNIGLRHAVETIAARVIPRAWTRPAGNLVVLGFAGALALLAWLSLTRYIVPGLS